MIFDYLVLVIGNYGYLFFLAFCVLKLTLLLWYKNGNVKFAIKNLFFLNSNVLNSSREKEKKEWPFFKKTYTILNIAIYIFLGLWIILYIIIQLANK